MKEQAMCIPGRKVSQFPWANVQKPDRTVLGISVARAEWVRGVIEIIREKAEGQVR